MHTKIIRPFLFTPSPPIMQWVSFIFRSHSGPGVCLGVVYLYADVEIRLPCWIKTESGEECCRNLCFVPRVGGTEKPDNEYWILIFKKLLKWFNVHVKRKIVAKQTTGVIRLRATTLFGKLRPRVAQENWGLMVGAGFFLGNVSLRWAPPSLSDLLLSSSERKSYSCTHKTMKGKIFTCLFGDSHFQYYKPDNIAKDNCLCSSFLF